MKTCIGARVNYLMQIKKQTWFYKNTYPYFLYRYNNRINIIVQKVELTNCMMNANYMKYIGSLLKKVLN